MEKIATFVRDLDGFSGEARLYRVSPKMREDDEEFEFVVVSATYALFSDTETSIFGADEEGKVQNWSKLDGSFRGGWDHELALEKAGYVIA